MVGINIPKIVKSYVPLHRSTPLNDTRKIIVVKNKLRTFHLFKSDFRMDSFLNILGFKERRVLTKFRIGSHHLEIELGRH